MDTNLGKVVLVKDINPGSLVDGYSGSTLSGLTEFNDKLYFNSIDGETSRELFVSDGTAAGTQLVTDLQPGSRDYIDGGFVQYYFYGSGSGFTEFKGKLYFAADDEQNGRELWVTDGTAEGTQLVADINSSPVGYYGRGSSFVYGLTEVNGKLYFSADNGEIGRELFVTDGTLEGTQLVIDTIPVPNSPINLTEFDDKLYFTLIEDLWVSDGTVEGTELFADLPRFPLIPRNFSFGEFDDKLYFSASASETPFGRELFVTDGTAEGTQPVTDIVFNSISSDFTEFNGKLYFAADDGTSGRELWVTDGTAEGTQPVTDISPDRSSSPFSFGSFSPSGFTEFNGKLYFAADDGTSGRELWVTDGTAEGTQLVQDIYPGSSLRFSGSPTANSSSPSELTVVNNELFFVANNGETGRELFKLTFEESADSVDSSSDRTINQALNPIAGTTNSDNLVGTDGDDEIAGDRGNDGITGELGSDVLNGGAGNDVLDGGAGDDTLNGGKGTDTAVYQFSPTAVTVSLGEAEAGGTASDGFGSTDSLFNLENVIGSDGDDNLTGNSGNNSLTGRGGNDTLAGGEGDDFLTGGIGADVLSGGEGGDRFVYLNPNDGGDTITDFAVGTDKVTAVSAVFGGGLSAGELPESSFVLSSTATTSEQRFVFNDVSGELFFDRDGNGAATQQLIATLDGVSNLSAGDIMLL